MIGTTSGQSQVERLDERRISGRGDLDAIALRSWGIRALVRDPFLVKVKGGTFPAGCHPRSRVRMRHGIIHPPAIVDPRRSWQCSSDDAFNLRERERQR